MRLKIYLLVLLTALFFAGSAGAQDYRPMAVDGAHWIVKQVDGVSSWVVTGLWEYHCNGDTSVDNMNYKKVYRRELQPTMEEPPFTPITYFRLYGFMRDDYNEKKVYSLIIDPEAYSYECVPNQENLLFDFSLLPGDSVNFCTLPSFYEAEIQSIVQGEVLGFETNIFQTTTSYEYYEGLGSQFGLFEDMFQPVKGPNELDFTELYYYCPSCVCPYVLPYDTLLTIGEVFDFAVNDQFQYKGSAPAQTPNADRITVTAKYYSPGNDTVFYELEHNSYSTSLNYNNGQPYLEYFFYNLTDTVYYTNLQDPIYAYDSGFFCNVLSYASSNLCDSLVNRYEMSVGPGFENDYYIKEYGKGLGVTYDYYYTGGGQTVWRNDELFYYKKGNYSCGTPDPVKTGEIPLSSSMSVFPNPAANTLNFNVDFPLTANCEWLIVSPTGSTHMKGSLKAGLNVVDIKALTTGLYLLKIQVNDQITVRKFVKE